MKRKIFSKKWLLIAASSLALAGCFDGEKQQEAGEIPPVSVVVITAEAQDVLVKVELPGRTKASKIAEVRPQVGGLF